MALKELLSRMGEGPRRRMRVPELWNTMGFEHEKAGGGEIIVDGAGFFGAAIRHALGISRGDIACNDITHDAVSPDAIASDAITEKASLQGVNAQNALPTGMAKCGDAIYALLPRHFTAWDHGDGLEGGTFLKAIALLPHIARFGVELVYLLPIFTPSDMYKKGTLGSPYAIKDFFKLDPALHDPLLGDYSDELLGLQFAAFVEACHALGLKVMVDFVFRTCARDNVFLGEHPDWFYWISLEDQINFAPPNVPDLPGNTAISPITAKALYAAAETPAYISRFRPNPRALDPQKFEKCGGDLTQIERAFGVTTAPAFSDVLNDHQPLWTDVTYLRMDFGKNAFAANYAGAPFLLHDTIKLDIFAPDVPNAALYAAMEDLIPHYILKYAIDGARIDMGHALPKPLLQSMIARIRACKPDFILWSEVFDIARASVETSMGFDFVTGGICFALQKLFYGEPLPELLPHMNGGPCVAPPEMPDTPRAALLYDVELPTLGGPSASGQVLPGAMVQALQLGGPPDVSGPLQPSAAWKSVVTLCASFPNARPFFCAGLELGEIQPMNLGLGESVAGRFALPATDPDYGKLAFFDACRLRWTSPAAPSRIAHIAACMAARGLGV